MALDGGGHWLRRRLGFLSPVSRSSSSSSHQIWDVSSVLPAVDRISTPPSPSACRRSTGGSGCSLTISKKLSALCRRSPPSTTSSDRRSIGEICGCRPSVFIKISAPCQRISLLLTKSAHPGATLGSFYVDLCLLKIYSSPLVESFFRSRSSAGILPPTIHGELHRSLLCNLPDTARCRPSQCSTANFAMFSPATLPGSRSVFHQEIPDASPPSHHRSRTPCGR